MNESLSGVTPVKGKYIKPAAQTLARAFQEYPVSVFLEPDAAKRQKEQPYVFSSLIRSSLSYGTIYGTSPKMEGVAVWYLVDKNKPFPKPRRTLREWVQSFREDKIKAQKRQAFMDFSQSVRQRVLPDRYWYLQLLGVDPAYQGKSFSSVLMKPMLELAKKQGLPCFLETQSQRNVSLYGHFGFVIVEEGTIPLGDVYSWAMLKK